MESQKIKCTVKGFGIRGYDHYKDNWNVKTHKKKQVLTCKVTCGEKIEAVGIFLKGPRIGTMPSVLSNYEGTIKLKQFLKKRRFVGLTEIQARVKENEPRMGENGLEVPCDYYLIGKDTPEIREALENIRTEVNNIGKQKDGISCSQIKKNKAKAKRERKGQPKDKNKENFMQSLDMTDGSGERATKTKASNDQAKSTHKSLSDGFGETVPKKLASTGQAKSSRKRHSDGSVEKVCKKLASTEQTKSIRKRRSDASLETLPKNVAFTGQMQRAKENGASEDRQLSSTVGSKIWFSTVANVTKQTSGEFINTTGRIETVQEAKAKVAASGSVCKIVYQTKDGYGTGTGFRVGPRYIMTAAHVSDAFPKESQYAKEVYAIFNYIKDGDCSKENIYYFKEVVYSDANTDIAVIELEDHQSRMPQAFLKFCLPFFDRGFFLIGHSKGDIMQIDTVVETIHRDSPGTQNALIQLQSLSMKQTGGNRYDTPPHNTPDNPDRILFHCKFTKGASGSPGVVIIGESVYVTTVLLHGYPDWYYDPTMECFKNSWQQEACIEQGVNMQSVHGSMSATHPNLSQEIFGIDPKW